MWNLVFLKKILKSMQTFQVYSSAATQRSSFRERIHQSSFHFCSRERKNTENYFTKFDSAPGLCNGTRYLVLLCGKKLKEAKIARARDKGQNLAKRIKMIPSHKMHVFSFFKRHSPVGPAFSLTSHKPQVPTFPRVGIHLPTPLFSLDKLYYLCSLLKGERRTQSKFLVGDHLRTKRFWCLWQNFS